MRNLIVISMMTLDGVIQGPGGPEEDTSCGFKYGGWVAPFVDDASGKVRERLMKPSDILLGRKTFQIWENYWPSHESQWPGINDVTKYVYSNTIGSSEWNNSIFLKTVSDIENLKKSNGSDIQVWGSSRLVQLLLKHDLVDELWLMIHPLTLGHGKKLFEEGPIPAAFELVEGSVTPGGVIVGNYKRAGEPKTGDLTA
jgi:dihydrofolate reductase